MHLSEEGAVEADDPEIGTDTPALLDGHVADRQGKEVGCAEDGTARVE